MMHDDHHPSISDGYGGLNNRIFVYSSKTKKYNK